MSSDPYPDAATTASESPRHLVLVPATEVLHDPKMLSALSAIFTSKDCVGFIFYAPDTEPSEVVDRLGPLVEVAFPSESGIDVQLLVMPSSAEQKLLELVAAVFSNRSQTGTLRALPRFNRDQAAALQSFLLSLSDPLDITTSESSRAPSSPFSIAKIMEIEGQIYPDEASLLYSLASLVTGDRAIVEIGSYRGRSTIALALGSRSGHEAPVFAVDPHEEFIGVKGGHYGGSDRVAFMKNVLDAGVADLIRLVNLPSLAAASGWQRDIGLLWLDGDHSYEGAAGDLAAWSPFLAPEAFVAFHDSYDDGPSQVISSALAGDHYRLIERVRGVTVLQPTSL